MNERTRSASPARRARGEGRSHKRLFRGLRHRAPAARYDVVVIGAGIGGLVCAASLARRGLAVLLVEQHYMVGGYCSTFRRGGFTFDASTHFYPLLGNPDTLTGKLLAEIGVQTDWVKMDPVDTFHFPDGSRFDVPADLATYRRRLDEAFPHEREGLARFFAQVDEAYMLGLLAYFRGRETPRLDAYREATVADVLARTIADPELRLLLTADCPHWGSRPSRTSFVFDAMLRLSYFLGNYYPVGGSQAFADELARCVEVHGGEILMSSTVEKILVDRGAVTGVEIETLRGPLRGRRRVAAQTIVAAGDLREAVHRLLPARAVDPAYRRALRDLRPSFPCFLVHVGLRGIDPQALEPVQGYYWDDWDPERVGLGGLRCKIFSPTLYEPAMAPPDGAIVILQKVLDMDPTSTRTWTAAQWAEHKAGLERLCYEHLCTVLPAAREATAVRLAASARTAWRFTRNHAGAMLGWEMAPDQLGTRRPSVRGPVDGLYFTGHWAQPGGGITPVIVSAVEVARAIAGDGSRPVAEGSLGRWHGDARTSSDPIRRKKSRLSPFSRAPESNGSVYLRQEAIR